MITAEKPKTIRVMFTPFRDGLQSSFGGKVRLHDFLPAMELAAEAGIRHFEFGGGARYQAPYFYLGEDPFEDMRKIRQAVGPDADLQILTRSVSGVTLTTQSISGLRLQAKLMKEYGTTWDRNFDYMNDVRNLIRTGRPIVEAGMHHQVCIALMGLPFKSNKVHTAEFYTNIGRQLLESDVRIDSICLKDASGTTDPKTIYDTAVELKKIMPPEMPLWLHTHDTASTAVACYMAGIAGGVDGIDLSVRPMASGTVQPDVRSMAHALKGTGYSLDIDETKMSGIEAMLNELMKDYDFNPTTTTADARVLGFPMPGGAIGPNVHMMVKAGILDKYSDVLAEFPVVVEAGGAWTSVTPAAASSTGCRRSTTSCTAAGRRSMPGTARLCSATLVARHCRRTPPLSRSLRSSSTCRRSTVIRLMPRRKILRSPRRLSESAALRSTTVIHSSCSPQSFRGKRWNSTRGSDC